MGGKDEEHTVVGLQIRAEYWLVSESVKSIILVIRHASGAILLPQDTS